MKEPNGLAQKRFVPESAEPFILHKYAPLSLLVTSTRVNTRTVLNRVQCEHTHTHTYIQRERESAII